MRVLIFLSFLCLGQYFLAVASAETLPKHERVLEIQPPREIQDFELTDQNGDLFRISQLRGDVVLVFFGFTNCPDVCPTTMARFKMLMETGGVDTSRVSVVLISVDGERDTPPAMKDYLQRYSSEFIGLTGEPSKVTGIAKSFRASFFKGAVNQDDGDYSIGHSPQSFVIDSTGRLRAELHSPGIDAMAGIVNALIVEADPAVHH